VNHDIYAFGSIVRGDVLPSSDVDILAIPISKEKHQVPDTWSVYSKDTISHYFATGRLFAWHLHLEARLLYSPNVQDYLSLLGKPADYKSAKKDVSDLREILVESLHNLETGSNCEIFDFGIVYTALRDIAMSASYSIMDRPTFSRLSPYEIPVSCPLPIEIYKKAMLARHCSTRGTDLNLCFSKERMVISKYMFDDWIKTIERKL